MTANSAYIEQPPLISKEFLHINRYWDNTNNTYAAKITPGEYYVSSGSELITTVLGSCIAACVRDVRLNIGGMNHFMLPHIDTYCGDINHKLLSSAARYGNVAMERLINTIMAQGGKRQNLEFKIFGGARVLDIDSDVGARNIQFIKEYLHLEGYKVSSHDVGGPHPRKVVYYPDTGRVRMKKLVRDKDETIHRREKAYSRALDQVSIVSEVTIFDHE